MATKARQRSLTPAGLRIFANLLGSLFSLPASLRKRCPARIEKKQASFQRQGRY